MAEHFGSIAKGWTSKDADRHLANAKADLKRAKDAKVSKDMIDKLQRAVKNAQAIRNQF